MRKNKRTRSRRTKRKEWRMSAKATTIVIVAVSVVLLCIVFAIMNIGNQKILRGIKINGLEVSGLTIEEAREYIEDKLQAVIHNGIKVNHNEQEYVFELNELNIEYNFEEQLQDAYKVGRSGNILQDNFTILSMLWNKKEFNFEITYNDELFERQIDYIEIQLPDRAVDNKYYIEGNDLIVVRGLDGVVLNKDEMKNDVLLELADLSVENTINIPVIEKPVEELNIDKIHEEIYQKPENAYYETNPFEIHPHVVGIDFAISYAGIDAMFARPDTDYSIPLKYTEPEVTLDNLNIDVFPDLLAQYDTAYDVTNKNKANNLSIALSKINGVVLKPGETFSYNKTLGARTIENGYKEAAIYSNGKIVNGLGGGICQGSTTLYNAVIMANLEIVERQNHMFVPSYVKPGYDATVVYGSIDFKFKNTRNYPIKIVASANSGVARVSIYGLYDENEYNVRLETEVLETTPYQTVYITDSSLGSGQEEVIQEGQNGIKVETYKVIKLGNTEISRELLSVDTYRPMQQTILRGR